MEACGRCRNICCGNWEQSTPLKQAVPHVWLILGICRNSMRKLEQKHIQIYQHVSILVWCMEKMARTALQTGRDSQRKTISSTLEWQRYTSSTAVSTSWTAYTRWYQCWIGTYGRNNRTRAQNTLRWGLDASWQTICCLSKMRIFWAPLRALSL